MQAQNVQTLSDFIAWGWDFSESIGQANGQNAHHDWAYHIEIYLLSVWQLALENRDNPLTWTLFACILSDARLALPSDYNPVRIQRTPEPHLVEGGVEFEYVGNMITHLIGELSYAQILMANSDKTSQELLSEFTEYDWKNPSLQFYLSCAISYFSLIKDKDTISCDWEAMGFFLMVGRNYE